jgi:putative glutamine transport system substrate-binding protein
MRTPVVLAFLLAAVAARADGSLDRIRARGKLVVSVKNDAARPHRDPAHVQKRGFELELAHALARRLLGDEQKLELRILARPARLPMLGLGSVDLVISMIPINTDIGRRYDLSHPYFASGLSLMTRKEATLTGLDGLRGQVVAVLKQGFNDHGAELARLADARGVPLTTRYFPSFDAAAQAVARGEAAAMVGNFVDLDAYQRSHPELRVVAGLLEPSRYGVAVRKGDAALLQAVNDTIDELARNGTLEAMTRRWKLPYLLSAH